MTRSGSAHLGSAQPITLETPLSLKSSLAFPVQHEQARREVLLGGLLLLLCPPLGWLLNMGHRIQMVHNMHEGQEAWPAWPAIGQFGAGWHGWDWQGWRRLLWHGWVTFLGMVQYHAPAVIVAVLAWYGHSVPLHVLSALLWLLATAAVPGYMTHYCYQFDTREIFDPVRALSRVRQGGAAYWHAWGIVLVGLVLSFVGLLGFGLGFLWTSVWFWQAAGFSFARVFTRTFKIGAAFTPSSATDSA